MTWHLLLNLILTVVAIVAVVVYFLIFYAIGNYWAECAHERKFEAHVDDALKVSK